MTTQNNKRIPLDWERFRNIRTVLQQRGIFFIAGHSSVTVPSRKEKYLLTHNHAGQQVCREWPTVDGNQVLMSPGEAARTELRRAFPTIKRIGWQPHHIKLFDWRWPMYAPKLSQGSNGSYIDLTGAYHQIYRQLWLDTAFPCGWGTLSMRPLADALGEWKGARNSLIGVTAARDVIGVKGYKTVKMKSENPYLAPHLWATIQAILNEIAFRAIGCGAVYVATDGYIFPSAYLADLFTEDLIGWGLKWRRIDGPYEIKGWGAWQVAKKKTKIFDRVLSPTHPGIRSVNVFDHEYPTRLVRWWAHSAKRRMEAKYGE